MLLTHLRHLPRWASWHQVSSLLYCLLRRSAVFRVAGKKLEINFVRKGVRAFVETCS